MFWVTLVFSVCGFVNFHWGYTKSHRSSVCLVRDTHYLYSTGFISDVDRYDPKLNIWTQMAPMSEQRGCACGLCLERKIYVFGGTVDPFSSSALVSCEVYDITLIEWQSITSMQVPRFHSSAVLLRDQVYLFGGIGSQSVDRHNWWWWSVTMSRKITGLVHIPCHIMRHSLEAAQSACLKIYCTL